MSAHSESDLHQSSCLNHAIRDVSGTDLHCHARKKCWDYSKFAKNTPNTFLPITLLQNVRFMKFNLEHKAEIEPHLMEMVLKVSATRWHHMSAARACKHTHTHFMQIYLGSIHTHTQTHSHTHRTSSAGYSCL